MSFWMNLRSSLGPLPGKDVGGVGAWQRVADIHFTQSNGRQFQGKALLKPMPRTHTASSVVHAGSYAAMPIEGGQMD